MGVEAMLESVDLVKAGKAPRIKQDESKATYEGRCGPGNAKIDWGKSWRQIDRLIRGCNPAPGAWTTLDGKTLKIFDAKPLPAKRPEGHRRQAGRDRRGRQPTASPWSAPTAASRSRACSRKAARRSTPANTSPPPTSPPERTWFPRLAIVGSHSATKHGPPPMPASQHQNPKSDIEIAQAAKMRPIIDIAREKLGIAPENLAALRPLQGQGVDGLHQVAADRSRTAS